MSQRDQITKQSDETFVVEMDYKGTIPLGANAISSSTLSAVKWLNTTPETKVVGNDILRSLSGTVVLPNRTKSQFWIENGTDNYTYQISILTTFDNGAILKDEVFVRVLNV